MNLRPILNEILLSMSCRGRRSWHRPLGSSARERLEVGKRDGRGCGGCHLFAVLHDSQRRNEMTDPQHGRAQPSLPSHCEALY